MSERMTISQFKKIISLMGFSFSDSWGWEVFQNCNSDLNEDAWVYINAPIEERHRNVKSYFVDGDTVDFAHFYRWLMENDEAERTHADMVRVAGDGW